MQTIVLLYLVLYAIPSLILDCLQIVHINKYKHKEAVMLSNASYRDAAGYAIRQRYISVVEHVVGVFTFMMWTKFGINSLYDRVFDLDLPSILTDLILVALFFSINAVVSFLIGLERRRLDRELGFSNQSLISMLSDSLKGAVVTAILGGILLCMLLVVMYHIDYWWVYSFVITFLVAAIANTIYPTLAVSMFCDSTPLKDRELSVRIDGLIRKAGFKSNGIFVVNSSKRISKLNAYFCGFGKAKRVILFDTLVDRVSRDGLVAILGHELGHFKNKDNIKIFLLSSVLLFIVFSITGNAMRHAAENAGIYAGHGGVIVLSCMMLPVVSFLFMPFIGYFSRKAEYEADKFGAQCVSKKALREALIRVVDENKMFPHSHPAFIFFYFSHPPLTDRLKAISGS